VALWNTHFSIGRIIHFITCPCEPFDLLLKEINLFSGILHINTKNKNQITLIFFARIDKVLNLCEAPRLQGGTCGALASQHFSRFCNTFSLAKVENAPSFGKSCLATRQGCGRNFRNLLMKQTS